ncbi:zinc finger and SCAN domain-containing protein 5B-like [Elephas maximus indicus]|uniref:zinc finger and SCAN domain-containing protein 5B-like n=1 Tax=Elephas maximus indicus TaxID=99487 RepID=UPI0021167D83|nr:zinc finger and SCAN domain-containing protein 5B-like [Elephas maximus indicus]
MAVDLTSSWRHGKPSEDCGSESPQLMSSQEADLGEKDYDPETWHVNFRAFTSSEGADPIGDLKRLSELCRLWLRPDLHTKEQILDKLVLEQFMISMPLDLQVLVKESGVKNCKDLEEMLRNNRRPVTWSVVCLQGQEFLLPNPDVQMAGSEASDMDDGQKLLPEAISANGELECPRPEQNLEENLMEDREGSTACDAQGSQLLKGSGDSVGANDRKNPKEDTSIKNVDADTPPTLILEREVSTTGQDSTGLSLYQCGFCEKRFHYKSQFDIHQRTHTGERPFKCSFCGKGFMQPSDVRVHQRIHTGEKPFKCELCHREFTHESTLHGHKRTHTNEKPFHCTECGKHFSHKGNLNVHRRIHSGTKPYSCPKCGHTFRQLGTFKRHEKTHSKMASQ